MWGFLGAALKLIADKKWAVLVGAAAIAMVIGAGSYAKTEIAQNATAIEKLKDNQNNIASTMKVMQGTLKNLNTTMGDLKNTMQQVDKTNRDVQKAVVDIYRDVYDIKLKQRGG
jgi:prefoldin subunit 5